jgi:hypothetical protein
LARALKNELKRELTSEMQGFKRKYKDGELSRGDRARIKELGEMMKMVEDFGARLKKF